MSQNKNELVNMQSSPDPKPGTGEGEAGDGEMHEVDQDTQEKAAEEREKSGGYD